MFEASDDDHTDDDYEKVVVVQDEVSDCGAELGGEEDCRVVWYCLCNLRKKIALGQTNQNRMPGASPTLLQKYSIPHRSFYRMSLPFIERMSLVLQYEVQ